MTQLQRSGPRTPAEAASTTSSEATRPARRSEGASGPVFGWCPPGGCPVRARETWLDGYGAALTDIAERVDVLDQTWRPATRRTPEQVRGDRFASLEAAEGTAAWLESARQKTLRSLGFVSSADRLTPALIAAGIKVSPLADCEWPPVAIPGGGQ